MDQDFAFKWNLSSWINTENMQPIVDKITPLIWTDINIVNAEGMIVASPKKHRIGKYHNAARMLLESEEDQLIIEHTNDVPGVLHGVNFPICIEGVRVGMIGITGKPSEVKLIAKLVRELLQFHITEARKDQKDSYLAQLRYHFLYEWLFDKSIVISRAFEERGKVLDIPIFQPWSVGVVLVEELKEREPQTEMLLSCIQECLKEREGKILSICVGPEIILLFQEGETEKVLAAMRGIVGKLREEFPYSFQAGVGRGVTEAEQIRRSLQDAKIMCRLSGQTKENEICSMEERPMEMLLQLAPREEMVRLFWKAFHGYSEGELARTMEMLRLYARHNGSINKVSEQLGIHKNTLQYRLNRLAERTGYVPQQVSDMAYLYVLMKIYELEIERKDGEG